MMNGIENITSRILQDAQAEADQLTAQAQAQARQIEAEAGAQAKAQAQAILQKGQAEAQQRRQRLASVAQLEARKLTLAAKQEMVGQAFAEALARLAALQGGQAVELLAKLAAAASVTGHEEVILAEKDRDAIGAQVVKRANELLARAVAPKLPDEVTDNPVGSLLDKVVAGASAMLAGTGMLTLAQDALPMAGGLVLRDGKVETNCSFETLVQLKRDELAAPVAKVLFG